ncbi:MAG: primosomal protein N' [Lachnospiraceae bacterium]
MVNQQTLYADIIINISHEALDRVFQYRVPAFLCDRITIGTQVVIPFGVSNREKEGYVVGLSHQAQFDKSRIKEILRVAEKTVCLEQEMITLAYWMKEQYGSTILHALRAVLPVKKKIEHKPQKQIRRLVPKEGVQEALDQCSVHHVAKRRILTELLSQEVLPYDLVSKKLAIAPSTIRSLVKQQLIQVEEIQNYRNPVKRKLSSAPLEKTVFTLNEEQQAIVEEFEHHQRQGIAATYLLHGVTGSGKTVVYIELIRRVLAQGKQAIVLIPEIALTYQMVKRFYEQFGERVSILNSRMSQGERYDQYLRAKRGEIDIMIGPRSALFAPFAQIGIIVMDEEHENSYKSETMPKYHAREVALQRASMHGASVVLGSATPSIESYTKAKSGEYRLWKLTKRAVEEAELAKVEIVDLRKELEAGNRTMFSRSLYQKIQERLEKKEQIMIFINRRGYANFVSCRSCGHVVKCHHCDVSLTIHKEGPKLACHYCGYTTELPKRCPKCGGKQIAAFGVGTQKVVTALQKHFPKARILRMDMDTTRGKDGHEKILQQFANDEADILVGTQMIAKGHDFANVTLVGIIAADLSLYSNDYRAGESTFQLLTQVAGRAGRASRPGEVVIQTYTPEHYSIQAAATQNYEEFYEQEMAYRTMLQYPPVCQMLVVLVTGEEEVQVMAAAKQLHGAIRAALEEMEQECTVTNPAPAAIAKLQDIYRRVIYVKSGDYTKLISIKNHLETYSDEHSLFQSVHVQFDFNPLHMY